MDIKKLNEELQKFVEKLGDILGMPVEQPADDGMGIGNVVKMVPTGFYLGVKDGRHSWGRASVRVVPNELYYAYGTSTAGVYKLDLETKTWKRALARPIDFRGIDYAESVNCFLQNTKKIPTAKAKELIEGNTLNNRPTFGDSKIQVGDKVITKDGLKGVVTKRFHDFAGQLFYKINTGKEEKNVFFMKVGLDK